MQDDYDHPSRLSGLPVELLTEILKFLPWKDVLHLRETCRILSEVTRAREIWVNLVQEYILSKEIPPHLERPIESHSSIELERLFLLWKSADIGWKKDDGHPAKERSFDCESAEFAHLVEGGRWYLLTNKTGAVTYYDLEAETITGVQLIPPQYTQGDFHVALEIDKDSPVLKFNMAFSSMFGTPFALAIPQENRRYHAVHVWNVSSVLDESGHVAGLFAARIAAFPHRPRLSTIFHISLRGNHIAFTCSDDYDSDDYLIVVHWKQANGNPSHCLRIVDRAQIYTSTRVYLLPGHRLFVGCVTSFLLYNYSTVKESTELLSDIQGMRNAPIWRHDSESMALEEFGVFYAKNTTKILVSTRDFLFAFDISNLDSPTPIEALAFPIPVLPSTYALGSTRAVFYDAQNRVSMLLRYSLSDGGEPLIILTKHIPTDLPIVPQLLSLDNETARSVLYFIEHEKVYVIDYALSITS